MELLALSFDWVTKSDLAFIDKHQKSLIYNSDKKLLCGKLYFEATCGEILLEDSYDIEIHYANKKLNPLPLVIETGNRISKLSKYTKIPLRDLHVNDGDMNKGVCLCSRIEAFNYLAKYKMSDKPTELFISDLVIPFFFSISYFSRYKKWPFGECHHGHEGLIDDIFAPDGLEKFVKCSSEYKRCFPKEYNAVISEYKKRYAKGSKKNKSCPCGSGIKSKKCHGIILNL